MVWYLTHDAQVHAEELGYAPLPEAAVIADEAQIMRVMFNGQPALPAELADFAMSR